MRIDEITASGWVHFEARTIGECVLTCSGEKHSARWELGERTTGRTRVFGGYYVRIALDGAPDEFLGFDGYNLRDALIGAVDVARRAGFGLDVAGAHPSFIERGLSWNSGWGEVDGNRVHMMDAPFCA